MRRLKDQNKRSKVLLSGVFGPFGVDDDYGRKENIMELFHNQVTRAQGIGSFRFHHRSFGLYFLAANIDADVTVLDFPSKERFTREVERGEYDIVGISFITPNVLKAKEMARIVRERAPRAEIIIGGHGAAIEGIEGLVDCDQVVKGEGIRWMRRHLGQDADAPLCHPSLPSAERMSIFGVPLLDGAANLLVPGVGCVNGCNFCCTSHFFGKSYTPFLSSGAAMFETACRIADKRGTDSFFVMDENFLKNRERALELLAEMERHKRFFRFHIFSSAEAIEAFGLDNMVRLGVTLVWIGFESRSRQSAYVKNAGIDARALVQGLRDRGIAVLASGILCMEHHTPGNMQEDIDFLVGLEPDFAQFMLLTAMPVTSLYRDHQRRGILDLGVPYMDWHGQKRLNFKHPAFSGTEPEAWLECAFQQDYEENSSSMLRLVETAVRGYEHVAGLEPRDECVKTRLRQLKWQARVYCLVLPTIVRHAVNPQEAERARALRARATELFGLRPWERAAGLAALGLAELWKLRVRLFGDALQPKTIVTRYKPGRKLAAIPVRAPRSAPDEMTTSSLPRAAAAVAPAASRS